MGMNGDGAVSSAIVSIIAWGTGTTRRIRREEERQSREREVRALERIADKESAK